MRRVVLLISILVAFANTSINATIINVPVDYGSIQLAINNSTDGDTVLVAPGDYQEHLIFNDITLTLLSSGGDSVTFISKDTNGLDIVDFSENQGNSSIIQGFSIRDAVSANGIRVRSGNSPQIVQCTVINNYSTADGGGIHCLGTNVIIRNCRILNNNASRKGGGIHARDHTITIDSSVFCGNYSGDGGGAISLIYSSGQITHNTIYENSNSDDYGGPIYLESPSGLEIINNTIVENNSSFQWGAQGSGIAIVGYSTLDIRNNIIGFNIGGCGIYATNAYGITSEYNDVSGGYCGVVPGIGSISLDPLFEDTSQANYSLQINSPCIDTGDPNSPLDPDGSWADMGAVYFYLGLRLLYNVNDFIFTVPSDSAFSATFMLVTNQESGYVKMFCDSSWVSFDVDSLSFIEGDTIAITATVNSMGLEYNQTHQTQIYFESDAPGLDDAYILTEITPVFLFDLIYNPGDFRFDLPGDSSVSKTFKLYSLGGNGYTKPLCDSSWVILDPDSVNIGYGDTLTITATFNSMGLEYNRTFQTQIYFESDAPGLDDAYILTEMTTIFLFDLIYDPEDFIFDVTGDSSVSRTFELYSLGANGYIKPLCDSSWVTFDFDSVEVVYGDTLTLTAVINATGLNFDTIYETEIYFDSDAPDLEDTLISVRMTTHAPTPITIEMIPDNPPVIAEPGGYFTYEGILFNNIGGPFPYATDVWINVEVRNYIYGPIRIWEDILVSAQDNHYPGATQYVHLGAETGDYTYIAYCGEYPEIMDSCYFEFTVVEGFNREGHGWDVNGWGDENIVTLPTEVTLYQNYPNPFNAATEIRYAIPEQSNVRLDIYNIRGQKVDMITNGIQPAGEYPMLWDASTFSSGIYFYRLTTNNKILTKRMTLLK